eukprot:scaffold90550_cov18-Tisochrysis_lutea.AAC.1
MGWECDAGRTSVQQQNVRPCALTACMLDIDNDGTQSLKKADALGSWRQCYGVPWVEIFGEQASDGNEEKRGNEEVGGGLGFESNEQDSS